MLSKILLSLTLLAMPFSNSISAAKPISVIFETDMGNDIDDVLALDMLYKYQHAGIINLLLISNNKGNTFSPQFIHIMNTVYGYPQISVATSASEFLPHQRETKPSYVEIVTRSGRFASSPSPQTMDSVEEYRRILCSQPDHSVVIISVGFSTNLHRLLKSEPDAHSSLKGCDLVARKVKILSMMGGNFNAKNMKEFNIRFDCQAARTVFREWPTDILLSPWEVGGQIFFKSTGLNKIPDSHPLKMAYENYLPMPYDRECWDQTSVIAAIETPQHWFGLSSRGSVDVDDSGRTKFTPAVDGRVRLLQVTCSQAKKTAKHIQKIIETPIKKHTEQ